MKDSHGAYDGRLPEPPYDCPSCQEKDARIAELEKERDRWYGAAQERQIRINALEKVAKEAEQAIRSVEPPGIPLIVFRKLKDALSVAGEEMK
jgi:hypothetical protein